MKEIKKEMNVFQFDAANLEILGISSNRRHAFFDIKMKIAHTVLYTGSILSSIFFFTQTESFRDYTDSIYTTSAITGIAISFTHIAHQADELFQFIENCRKLMDDRKLTSTWAFESQRFVVAWQSDDFIYFQDLNRIHQFTMDPLLFQKNGINSFILLEQKFRRFVGWRQNSFSRYLLTSPPIISIMIHLNYRCRYGEFWMPHLTQQELVKFTGLRN